MNAKWKLFSSDSLAGKCAQKLLSQATYKHNHFFWKSTTILAIKKKKIKKQIKKLLLTLGEKKSAYENGCCLNIECPWLPLLLNISLRTNGLIQIFNWSHIQAFFHFYLTARVENYTSLLKKKTSIVYHTTQAMYHHYSYVTLSILMQQIRPTLLYIYECYIQKPRGFLNTLNNMLVRHLVWDICILLVTSPYEFAMNQSGENWI